MKFTCSKDNFSEGIRIVLKAVTGKSTIPTLDCIAIETKEDKISLTTNNMELGINTLVESHIIEEGSILVNAKIISDIVSKLPEDEVEFDADSEQNILLKCEKSKFNISGMSSEEFTFLPEMQKSNQIEISQFSLKEIIRQTIFSVSTNENNRILTGELFEIKDNYLCVTSLDLYRVAVRRVMLDKEYDPIKVVIPGKTLNEISKILNGNSDDMLTIYFSSNHILFEFDDTIVLSRLIEGNYYDINRMISNDYETKITINKAELFGSIDRAILLLREKDKKPVVMNIKENIVTMEMKTLLGSMDESFEIEKEGEDIVFAFNPKFLIDILRVIDDEDITLYMTNSKAPCYIRDYENAYLYMILPVNISNNS
jgi:DNA polymerase-3 subunit beta